MSLLPPNASQLERGLEQATARAGNVTVDFTPLWNPQTCPIELLPYLAFALSIDTWDPAWPEATKRALVSTAIDIQRHKGTAKSIRDIIRSFGGQIALREWWQMAPPGTPHTFSVVLSLTGAAGEAPSAGFIDQIIDEIRRTKPVRSHFTFGQAIVVTGGIRPVGAARPALFHRLAAQTAVNASRTFDFTAGTLPIGATLSRSTSATCIDAAGVLVTRSAHTPRFDYSGGVLLGLLIEPAATNVSRDSQAFTTGRWSRDGTFAASDNSLVAPDGTTTGSTWTGIRTSTNGRIYEQAFAAGGRFPSSVQLSPSFWIKPVSTTGILVVQSTHGPSLGSAELNLALLSTSAWQRIYIGHPALTSMTPFVSSAAGANGLHFDSKTGSILSVGMWGVQLEAGAAFSSYIATTTASVTRAADALTLNWAMRGVLDGMRNIRYTFDDLSTQTVPTAIAGGLAVVPTTLTRARLRNAEAL